MDYQLIKSKFRIAKDKGDTCQAVCPSHPDAQASLSITYKGHEGKTVLYCHAGCETKDIVEAAGLTLQDLFDDEFKPDEKKNNDITATYHYRNARGELLYDKVRIEKPGQKKTFIQKRIVTGATVWGLDGGTYYESWAGSNSWSKREKTGASMRNFPSCEPVIYNLPEVIKAVDSGKEVHIVEGEKDADNLTKLGFVATCNFDGASASGKKPKWKSQYNEFFKGAKLIIWNDNDDPGRAHADHIAKELHEIAESIKRPDIPGLQEKEDISDWLTAGHGLEDIQELLASTPQYEYDIADDCDLIPFNFSDVGNAERLMARYGKTIRYNPIRDKWLIWSGKHWALDSSGKIQILARKTIRKMQQQGDAIPVGDNLIEEITKKNEKLKSQVRQYVLRSESDAKIKAMISQAKTQKSLVVKYTDRNLYIINLINGSLNLKTGALESHNKHEFITRLVDIEYDPTAQCPNWIEFINKIFLNNTELVNFVQKSIGYSMTGDASLQCFYICHGQGSNGKGTFMKTIMTLLGEYAGVLKGGSLMEKMGDEGARGDLAKLENKYFVCVNELEENKAFDEALVKALSSGADEVIPVRRMYEEEFDLHPTFKLWMTTNKLPKIKGTDEGIWRRIRKIPFEYNFEKDTEKNPRFFEDMLLPEIPGILNWALEGCMKWQSEGMQLPDIVKYANDDYRNDMDPIQRFINEECIVSETCRVKVSALYDVYTDWCHENKEYVLSAIKFSKKLAEKDFKQSRVTSARFWNGIGIIDNEQQSFNECTDNVTPFWQNDKNI